MTRRTATVLLIGTLAVAGCAEVETEPGNAEVAPAAPEDAATDAPAAPEDAATDAPAAAAPATALPTINLTGSGKTATEKFTLEGGATVFRMTHTGSSNFAVQILDGASGDLADLLANDIGKYEGSTVVGVEAGDYVIDVEADGDWTIAIEQQRPTTGTVGSPVTGTGPSAVGPISFPGGLVTFALKHGGTSNFAVQLLDRDGGLSDLLANEIGDFEGTTAAGVDEGIYWMDVDADGSWSISFSS